MMRDDRNEDNPPFSRVFVVCSKTHKEEDLRPAFEKHGSIEFFNMPKDRTTGENKGIAYIKYRKTSSAAAAIEALNLSHLPNSTKPIKVMVASKRNEETADHNENKYKRLFIKVSKDATESEIIDHFKKFGNIEKVLIQKNRETKENKGFAYVNYDSFLEAALAFEECDKKYKPVFATPREDLKRSRTSYDQHDQRYRNNYDQYDQYPSTDSVFMRDYPNDNYANHYRDNHQRVNHQRDELHRTDNIMPLLTTPAQDYDTISVLCTPLVSQKPIEKLFNIIPGMIQFTFTTDNYNGVCKAVVKYETKVAAAHAVETINNYQFPSGEVITVQPDNNPLSQVATNLSNIVNSFKNSVGVNKDLKQLADVIAQASTLIQASTFSQGGSLNTETRHDNRSDSNDSFSSVRLPPVKPLASSNSKVAQRCFIVLKPHSLTQAMLRNIFCRFGDLIDVSANPMKSYGFAKYASKRAAQEAIKTLHGATVHGIKLKVMEAEEKPTSDQTHDNENNTDFTERKRPKLDEMLTDD